MTDQIGAVVPPPSRRLVCLLTSVLLVGPSPGSAQPPPRRAGAARLGELRAAAVRLDPRARQFALREAATELRLRNLGAERLPRFSLAGDATYQSDVPSLAIELPGAPPPPAAPKARYQATLDVEQLVFDGGALSGRGTVARRRLAEEQESLRVRLYALREQVDATFFTARLLQEQLAELALLDRDLEARLRLVGARARAGTALPSEPAALQAERILVRQQRDEADASRRAALAVLGELTGRRFDEADVLVLPEAAPLVDATRPPGARARPEYAQFARRRERLEAEAALASRATSPRLSVFGQLGYGRPGLDFLSDEFQLFGVAGVRLRWSPWSWGSTRREVEELRLEQRIVATEEAELTRRLGREVQDDLQQIRRLEVALGDDDALIALREAVEREARSQLESGVMNAADYVARRTDVSRAHLARRTHRVELARARVRYLTTLGIDLP